MAQWAASLPQEGRGRIKWHMPLLRDATFGIVPGSHLRWRTEEERQVLGHYNGEPACLERAARGDGLCVADAGGCWGAFGGCCG